MPRSRDSRKEDARALLAVSELMQCKLLSPATIEYLAEVRDMLQEMIKEQSAEDSDVASA